MKVAVTVFLMLFSTILIGCLNPDTKAVAGAPAKLSFVASSDVNMISTFQVDPGSGQLSNAAATATGVCGGPIYVEVHPSKEFLLTACSNSDMAAVFSIDPGSGSLTMMGPPAATGVSPRTLSLDPQGRFVYVSSIGSNNVSGFAIGSSGQLMAVPGSPFATGLTPYTVKVSDSGPFV